MPGPARSWAAAQRERDYDPDQTDVGARLRRWQWAYVGWGPLSGLLTLLALVRSGLSREIVWRGVRYRLVSPTETVVLE